MNKEKLNTWLLIAILVVAIGLLIIGTIIHFNMESDIYVDNIVYVDGVDESSISEDTKETLVMCINDRIDSNEIENIREGCIDFILDEE